MSLSTLVSFLFGASTTLAAVKTNDVTTRYFVGPFNNGEFPMAIDQCLPTSVLGTSYQMVTCDSESHVTWTQYSDAECTNVLVVQETNSTLTKSGMGSYFDFNCDEEAIDAYTEVEFSIGTCNTNTKVTMAAALATCVANTGLSSVTGDDDLSDVDSIIVYCDSTIAELQYYDSPDSIFGLCYADGDNKNLFQIRNATTTCDYMLTTGDTDVYGRLIECSVDPVPTVIDMDDSASRLSMVVVVIASVFAALLM